MVAAASPVSQFSTAGRNIYRLALAELDGLSAAREVIGSTYDDRVCAFSVSGQHLWDVSVGGFVFDLTAGDLDGNGRDEILAACADGHVYAIDGGGNLLWKRDLGAPVWQVATARVDDHKRVALAGGVSRRVVAFSSEGEQLAISRGGAVIGVVRMMRRRFRRRRRRRSRRTPTARPSKRPRLSRHTRADAASRDNRSRTEGVGRFHTRRPEDR